MGTLKIAILYRVIPANTDETPHLLSQNRQRLAMSRGRFKIATVSCRFPPYSPCARESCYCQHFENTTSPPSTRCLCSSLDEHSMALSASSAGSDQCELAILVFEAVGRRGDQTGACCAKRMAYRQGAAPQVEFGHVHGAHLYRLCSSERAKGSRKKKLERRRRIDEMNIGETSGDGVGKP